MDDYPGIGRNGGKPKGVIQRMELARAVVQHPTDIGWAIDNSGRVASLHQSY